MVSPKYARVQNGIVNLIATENIKTGEMLPTEKKLSEHFDVSIITIRRAVRHLEENKIVRREQGRGTFVITDIQGKVDNGTIAFLDIVRGEFYSTSFGPSVKSLDSELARRTYSLNVLMAGEDAVAIDSCIARIIGVRPMDVAVIKTAYEAGMGEADLAKIEIAGESLEGFIAKDFKLPQTMILKIIPGPILKWLFALVGFKPRIDEDICVRCKLCKTACPVDCITIEEFACGIDYKKCIRCLCCHEICPHKAIAIGRNILTRLIWG